jgi:hypothetical protein
MFDCQEQYQTLIAEFQNDPEQRGYATKDSVTRFNDLQEERYEEREPFYPSYRTLLSVLKDPIRLEQIRTVIESTMPTVHAMLLAVGNTNGTAGGLNLQEPKVREYFQQMVGEGEGKFTAAEANEICSLGVKRVNRTYQLGLTGWLTLGRCESAMQQMGAN